MSNVLTARAIEGFKQHADREMRRARYRIGSVFYDSPIHRRERLPDGRVAVYFSITPNISGNVTISEVQIFDTNNELWASNSENIVIHGIQAGLLYRFTIDFKEV